MDIREMDWRQSSVWQILSALSQGLETNVRKAHDDDALDWEVDDALDYADDLCGIAFVTAQAYIAGVVADVARLRGASLVKHELIKLENPDNPSVADTKLTRVHLCDTMANYYKHRDEWAGWNDPKALRTTSDLRTAGFSGEHRHICTTAAALLFGDARVESLVPLVDMLSAWRVAVIGAARA